jgi:hypothetical protein
MAEEQSHIKQLSLIHMCNIGLREKSLFTTKIGVCQYIVERPDLKGLSPSGSVPSRFKQGIQTLVILIRS